MTEIVVFLVVFSAGVVCGYLAAGLVMLVSASKGERS